MSPFDIHIVGPTFNYFQTVFITSITLFLQPSVNVSISVLSHREAPGGYFTDPTNALNLGIRDYTSPSSGVQALITGWYGVAGTGTFNRDFVPTAWQGGSDLPVYRDAVKVSCRACHTTRSLDFTSPASVGSCGYNTCNSMVMPDAQRIFSILWGSKSANVGLTCTPPNQPAILSTRYGVGNWIAPCP